jgi:hypothetical protein
MNPQFRTLSGVDGSPSGHSFLANLTNEVAYVCLASADLNSLGADRLLRGGLYAEDAQGRTVRPIKESKPGIQMKPGPLTAHRAVYWGGSWFDSTAAHLNLA